MSRKRKQLTQAEAWELGVKLACELLDKSFGSTDEMSTNELGEPRATPQHNLMWGYIRKLRSLDDERVDSAFGAVLSDFTASCVSADSSGWYEDCGEAPIRTRATTADPVPARVRARREAAREERSNAAAVRSAQDEAPGATKH